MTLSSDKWIPPRCREFWFGDGPSLMGKLLCDCVCVSLCPSSDGYTTAPFAAAVEVILGRLWKMLFASRVFLSCNRIRSAVFNKDALCVQQTWSLKHIWWWSISCWSRVSWCRFSIPYLGIRTQNHGAFIWSSWFCGRFVLLNTPLLSHWWWTCSA